MTPGRRHQGQSFSVVVLFLLLPLFALNLIGSASIDHYHDLAKKRADLKLKSRSEKILNFLDPAGFLQSRFRAFVEEAYKTQPTTESLRTLIPEFSRDGIEFVPYIICNDKLITPAEFTRDYDLPAELLWQHLHQNNYQKYQKIKTKVRSALGPVLPFGKLVRSPGRVMEFTGRFGPGVIFYHPLNSGNGALIIAWQLPATEKIARFLPNSLKSNVKILFEPGNSTNGAILQTISRIRRDSGWLWFKKIFNNSQILIMQKFNEKNQLGRKRVFQLASLVVGMLLLMLFHQNLVSNSFNKLSIRIKLTFLALYVIAFPMAGLGYFGWKLTTERQELLQQEAINACLDSINEIDTGFDRDQEDILNFYRSFKTLFKTDQTSSQITDYFFSIERMKQMNWVEVRNINTNVVSTTQDPNTSNEIGIVGKTFARHGITNYLNHRLAPTEKLTPSASEVLIQEFLESPLGGWARVFESPDELSQITFGGYDLLWYWDVFPDDIASAAFIVCDNHLHWAINNYLNKCLIKRIPHGQAALRMIAWSHQSAATIPGNEKLTGETAAFLNQIKRNRQPQTTYLSFSGQKWLAAGAPGKRLRDHILICLYPEEIIVEKLQNLRNDIAWAMIFTLFLAILIGRLFSQTMIEPILRLMTGVQAIRKRDVSMRIETLQNDELGKLSQSFNQTIETLTDIVYARKIQEQMIPASSPAIPGWKVAVSYLPAADLGGDYCDIQRIDDRRLLAAIGDVTGHGVSSALVTAMAKAIVSQNVIQKNSDIKEIFKCLNELLYQQFQRKKCMTMFLALIDSGSGEISCINAGHPLPILLRNGSRVRMPELFHPPLGFSIRNPDFPEAAIKLEPGDCLILYTDILIETRDRSGKALGSTGFEKICRECNNLAPEAMSTAIIRKIQELNDEELDDDLSLMIIKRSI
ncbi:MAG: SpoIIE family protein phosphatase [Candidatus Riflebacteria bacterium]